LLPVYIIRPVNFLRGGKLTNALLLTSWRFYLKFFLGVGSLKDVVSRRVKLFLENYGARLYWVIGDCSSTFLLDDNEGKTTATKNHNELVRAA
jgi:hypothetical protein